MGSFLRFHVENTIDYFPGASCKLHDEDGQVWMPLRRFISDPSLAWCSKRNKDKQTPCLVDPYFTIME